ncbi:MAG: peptidoglycan recognition family protein [Bacteroidota bacterium]
MLRLLAALVVLATASGLAASGLAAQESTPLPPGVAVVSRAEWGGPPPALPMIPQVPHVLTVHHTATPQRPDRDPAETLQALYAFSVSDGPLGDGRPKRPWADVPYHFYIAPGGAILEARDVAFEGDTNTRYDLSGHVLIVLEGNFDVEQPTEAQLSSLFSLSEALAAQWGFGPEAVGGHADRAPGQTACPGDALEARLGDVRAAVRRGAFQSLSGAWTLDLRPIPDADVVTYPFDVAVDADGALTGSFYGAEILDGRVNAEWNALHLAFTTSDRAADGGILRHEARVVGGRLEGTTYAPHRDALWVWTATRDG